MPNRYAEQIAELVTIPDVLQRYGYALGRNRRIPCPLHHGKDANFCYTDRVYHCWTCDARGDVIRLVMELFGLSFGQAVTKINSDFALGLQIGRPSRRQREIDRQRYRAMKQQQEEKRRLRRRYLTACGLHATLYRVHLSGVKIDGLPQYIDRLEEWLDDHAGEVVT